MPQRGDPKYVRLPERLVTGSLGDVEGSGWFIGGMDVKPFPSDDEPQAQNFVRTHLRMGNIEEAAESEHKVVQDARDDMRGMHLDQLDERERHDRAGHQEAQLLSLSRRTGEKLSRLRRRNSDEDEELEADAPRTGGVGGTDSASAVQTAGKARQEARRGS